MSITTNKHFVDLYFQLVQTDGLQRKGLGFMVDGYEYLPNPFRKDLDDATKAEIKEKVHCSLWYMVKELSFVPVLGGERVRFDINKTNLAALMCMEEGINVFASQPRQLYGTMTRAIFVLWKLITDKKFKVVEISPAQSYFVDKVIALNNNLPEYLRLSEEEIKESVISKAGKRCSVDWASKFKGLVIINDLEYIENAITLFNKLKKGIENGTVQVSAHGCVGPLTCPGRFVANKIIEKSTHWTNQYFRQKTLRDAITNFAYINYPYTELVDNPEEWYKRMEIMFRHDQYALNREILLIR